MDERQREREEAVRVLLCWSVDLLLFQCSNRARPCLVPKSEKFSVL